MGEGDKVKCEVKRLMAFVFFDGWLLFETDACVLMILAEEGRTEVEVRLFFFEIASDTS